MGIWQMAGITETIDKTLSWKGFTIWCSVCRQSVRIYLASEIYQYCVLCPKGIWEAYREGPALETFFIPYWDETPRKKQPPLRPSVSVSCGGGYACHWNSERDFGIELEIGVDASTPGVHWKLLQAKTPSRIMNFKEIKSDVSKKKKENS